MSEEVETKRGRVRRLLIEPLIDAGFRFKAGTDADWQKREMNRMLDSVSYMSDAGLAALRQSMRTKGEGSAKCFWPCFASVVGLAEAFERRPLGELPELLRWFASQAGRDALAGGRLVAEYRFWHAKKHPPVTTEHKRAVQERAEEWEDRVARIRERVGRGLPPLYDDGEFLSWYDRTLEYVAELVRADHGAAA